MRTSLLLLLAVVGTVVAKANILAYTVTPSSGQFSYDFTLTNTGSTGGTLYDLFLSVPLDISDIDTTTIGTPVGWGDTTGGLLFFGPDVNPSTSFIEWAADASGLYDVGIGNSLSGFSFVSSHQVSGPIAFALNGSTTFDLAEPITSVPEPSTLALFLACISSLLISQWKRLRRKKRSVKCPT